MVFTQSRGFVLGASFGLQIRSLRCRVQVCSAADTAFLATSLLFGKLIGVAMTFGFGEKRCRKNLPLADASRMPINIKLDRAFLTVVWCDRCQRAINTNDETDHWHEEQCGGCRKFQKHDSDFGWCKNHESVYCGRLVFEHDTCSKFIQGKWS